MDIVRGHLGPAGVDRPGLEEGSRGARLGERLADPGISGGHPQVGGRSAAVVLEVVVLLGLASE